METKPSTEMEVNRQLEEVLQLLRNSKPEERNEIARRYAVTITELEKVIAYFKVYIVWPDGDAPDTT